MQTDEQMLDAIRRGLPVARRRALDVGPMHSFWEDIFLFEEVTSGKFNPDFWPYKTRSDAIRSIHDHWKACGVLGAPRSE